jgi:hypothetical protein
MRSSVEKISCVPELSPERICWDRFDKDLASKISTFIEPQESPIGPDSRLDLVPAHAFQGEKISCVPELNRPGLYNKKGDTALLTNFLTIFGQFFGQKSIKK